MEQEPNNEQVERRRWLVENLSKRGYMDTEVQEALRQWVRVEEDIVLGANKAAEAHIEVMVRQAVLCKEAKLLSEAYEILESAWGSAYHSHNEELCRKIEDSIDELA